MESYTMLSRFLRSRREKKSDKAGRGGKKKNTTGASGKDDKSDTEEKDEFRKSDIPTTQIDEEGYTLRPMTTCENDKSSFYSSSDSDDEKETKLRVEIKPLRNGTIPLSASVDELRSTVENMTLSPVGTTGRKVFEGDIQMKRSQSVSQQIGNSSPLMRYSYSPLSPPIPPPNPRARPKVLGNPLITDVADTIPLAVAFHEIIHACFKGNNENQCQIKMAGDIMVSFPAGIIQVFANNPRPAQLRFQVISNLELDNLVPNDELLSVRKDGNDLTFDFDMNALILLLKKLAEEKSGSSYFNVDILKYHIIPKSGVSSCPLHLVAFWKFEKLRTDLRIDYKYNSSAMISSSSTDSTVSPEPLMNKDLAPLLDVCVAAPVDGGVKSMQSKPTGQWFPSTNRACWKLPVLSSAEGQNVGSLRARFEVTNGPSSQGTIAAKFSCENSILSGAQFLLLGSGYRVSLVKKRFISGKYTCDT